MDALYKQVRADSDKNGFLDKMSLSGEGLQIAGLLENQKGEH